MLKARKRSGGQGTVGTDGIRCYVLLRVTGVALFFHCSNVCASLDTSSSALHVNHLGPFARTYF